MAKLQRVGSRMRVSVPTHHTEEKKNEWGGTTRRRVEDGALAADVELYVDLDAVLRNLGERAAKNRSGRARILRGLIEARVVGKPTKAMKPTNDLAKDLNVLGRQLARFLP